MSMSTDIYRLYWLIQTLLSVLLVLATPRILAILTKVFFQCNETKADADAATKNG